MRRFISILLSVCSVLLVSCSEEEMSLFGSLSGLVKNSETGTPLSGARVTLNPTGLSVLTGSDGSFSFTNLDPADYTVAFSADDYESVEQRVSVKPGVDASVQVVLIPVKPVLSVSTHVLEFGKDNTKLSFDVSNSGKGTLEWSVSEDIPWLSVSPQNGTNKTDKTSVVVTVSRDGLDGGSRSGSIVIASNGGSETVVAMLEVEVLKPALSVSTHVLDFGKDNTTLSVDISNSGTGTLEWSISEDISWLSVKPDKGSTKTDKSTVVFTVSRDGLENGSHTKSLVISSNGGSETLVATLEVDVLNLSVSPSELDFGTVESTLQLTLKNTGTGSVRYNVRSDNSWCAPNKTSGTVTDTDYLNIVVSRGDLAAGKYNTTVFISTNGGELAVPVKMEVVERQMPTVTLESVEDITYNSATAKGTLLSVGSEAVTRYGVCYGTNDSPTVSDKVLNLGDAKKAQSFQSTLTGLQSETTYYVRAFAENSVGLAYSERSVRFTTTGLPTVPTVETGVVYDVTSDFASARGTIVSLGNVEKVTSYGHVWGKTPGVSVSSNIGMTKLGETIQTISYVSSLKSLDYNTTYYVKAYATNSKGTAYGEEISFTTEKGEVKLNTADASEIVHNAATVGGTITSDGGNSMAEAGVCHGVSSSLDINSDHVVASVDGNSFSARLTGLATETNYYIRAYVKTDNGKVYYGSTKQFTTTKEVKLPTLGAVTVTNIKTDGATLSSRTANNGNSAILENGFCWSEYGTPTVDNDKVSCSVATNFGTAITGLTDGTTYYVRAWARNAMGLAYSEEVTFKTIAITPPEVSTPQILNVNMNWATAQASVLSTGNTKLDDAGFCLSTSPTPTIFDEKYSLGKVTELSVKFEGLTKSTTYYIRAYAENSAGLSYSNEVSFTTAEADPTVWDGRSVATSFAGGVGSESNPIRIATAAQLKLLANNVNNGNTYENIYFALVSNLDLGGHEWEMIGNSSTVSFKGTFDGNGHYISNCLINNSAILSSGGDAYSTWGIRGGAFFGRTSNAVIKNLALGGVNSLEETASGYWGDCIGGIVAYGYGGQILNCVNYIEVKGGGGIMMIEMRGSRISYYPFIDVINSVNYAQTKVGIGGTYANVLHSYWVFDVSSSFGVENSGVSGYATVSDSYSFARESTCCLIAPGYSTDLVQELNSWVSRNNDSDYGHLCKWTYEYVDGYARPTLIPED